MARKGTKFENAVAELHKLFGEGAEVSRNQYIKDVSGIKREFDVVIKAKISNYEMLGLIECKDYKRKVDVQVIDAFAKKTESVNANFKVIFSKSGFTKNAVKLAEKYGIKAYSLIDEENEDLSITAYWYIYGKTYTFTFKGGDFDRVKDFDQLEPTPYNEMFFRKRAVIDLVIKQIMEKYNDSDVKLGLYDIEVIVPDGSKRFVSMRGKRSAIKRIKYSIEVGCDLRRKKLLVKSKGMYDWHTNKMTAPKGQNITTESFQLDDMKDWDKCESIPKDDVFKLTFTNIPYPVDGYKESLGMLGEVTLKYKKTNKSSKKDAQKRASS